MRPTPVHGVGVSARCAGLVLLGLLCWLPGVHHAQAEGLSAQPEALAPTLLSVPGEAMLLDPPDAQNEEDAAADRARPAMRQKGLASWYGLKFHRRRTASGEMFDVQALTAAHPTLPFGTRVCVHSPDTGRSVVVRINDRGPLAPGRVIDLSQGAAQALGMLGLGLKPVELSTLAQGSKHCPAP